MRQTKIEITTSAEIEDEPGYCECDWCDYWGSEGDECQRCMEDK